MRHYGPFAMFFSFSEFHTFCGAASPSRLLFVIISGIWLRGVVLDCTFDEDAPLRQLLCALSPFYNSGSSSLLAFPSTSLLPYREGQGESQGGSVPAEIEDVCNLVCPHETSGSTGRPEKSPFEGWNAFSSVLGVRTFCDFTATLEISSG